MEGVEVDGETAMFEDTSERPLVQGVWTLIREAFDEGVEALVALEGRELGVAEEAEAVLEAEVHGLFEGGDSFLQLVLAGFEDGHHEGVLGIGRVNEGVFLDKCFRIDEVILGEVLGAKRIELYKARTILEDEAMSKILEEIVNHLEYVLIVLAKMELSSTYGERSAIGMQGRMKEVVELESSYMSLVESL